MNYKDLPGINRKIQDLHDSVARWERTIDQVKRFHADSYLVTEYSKSQADVVREIQDLQAQRDEIIGQMSMDERTKAVLLLHYDTGMTWKQVAEHEGVSLRTVYRIAGEK